MRQLFPGPCLGLSAALMTVVVLVTHPDSIRAETLFYPTSDRHEHHDEYHGVRVADPYRWLEEDARTSSRVADWVDAQNRITFEYLEAIPQRQAIEQRLTELWNYQRRSVPRKVGGRYFYTRNDGLQDQSVLLVTDSLASEAHILLDPNAWSDDGTVSLASWSPSPDGRYLAYATSRAGSDWRTWHVLEIDSGTILGEPIEWSKFSSVEWAREGSGFYYARYDRPEEGAEFHSVNLNQKLYFHRIGTSPVEDFVVYERPDQPEWRFSPEVTEDGAYLIIEVSIGTDDRYRIFYRDLTRPESPMIELIDNFEHQYSFLSSSGPVLYFLTTNAAPSRRVIAIDTHAPGPEHWREVIGQTNDTLQWATLIGNQFIAGYLSDARSTVRIYSEEGAFVREIDLPGIGTVSGFSGQRKDTETFYSFSSLATPPAVYRYDLLRGTSELHWRADVGFPSAEYRVEQVFYRSRDGTRVPMFLAHRRSLVRDGSNPTLLWGYGGFGTPVTPGYSSARRAWLEMGGVLAVTNLRGGEYGEEWHEAGAVLQKQNSFDDFIAAAEWLIESNITRRDKLAIQGGSNGGLLVGAVMTQRPDLFGAALPAVGVMDMLRFHNFTAGQFWTDEYGSPDDPEQFEALLAYSPYHNLKEGVAYPATLVTTADTDDRVVPAHSFKFAAQLQHAQSDDAPVLIRIETSAGHGGSTSTSKQIQLVADQWAFLAKNLGIDTSESTWESSQAR